MADDHNDFEINVIEADHHDSLDGTKTASDGEEIMRSARESVHVDFSGAQSHDNLTFLDPFDLS